MGTITVTQAVLEVIVPYRGLFVEEPEPEVPVLAGDNAVLKYCTCWAIERIDGIILFFTEHNQQIEFEGNIYTPIDSMKASAHQQQAGMRDVNYEVRGIISSNAISHADLLAGRYREAKITEYLVDWAYPWAGYILKSVHWIDTLSFDGEVWHAQLAGLSAQIKRPIGDIYGRTCRWNFGSSECTINLNEWKVESIVVTEIIEAKTKFQAAGSGTDPSGYWDLGKVVWEDGSNEGITCELKTYTYAPNEFILAIPAPFNIQLGDAFTLYRGCNKTLGDCFTKYINTNNFGGFPTIPGGDHMMRSPATSRGLKDIIKSLLGL